MGLYLWHSSFTAQCWAEQISETALHLNDLDAQIAAFGGKSLGSWLAFGNYDMIKLVEMPDNATMAAFVLHVTSGGHYSAGETTVLLSMEEGLAALSKAHQAQQGG